RPEATPETAPVSAPPEVRVPSEDPPWSGWDVARIGLMMFVLPYVFIPVTALVARQMFYKGVPWIAVAQKPWIALSTQFLWYLVVAIYMVTFVEGTFHRSFWESIQWNWPRRNWQVVVPLGMVLVSLQFLERFFRLPKHIPMEEFLKTPLAALMTGVLAISLGPLMAELYFIGFLYPVVARRFGAVVGVVATSMGFGLIHGAQLAFALVLVFII